MRKLLLLAVLLAGCTTAKKTTVTETPIPDVSSLRLLHKYVVPYNRPFKGTTIGGLSGIDYDSARKVYYIICDDRSEKQPARFYTAQVPVSRKEGDSVIFKDVTYLRKRDGKTYPSKQDFAPDPEAMRYNPHTQSFVWSSEGERILSPAGYILNDPGVYEIDGLGRLVDSFPLPPQFHMQASENGPRRNGTFEGLGFTPNGQYMFVSLEEPRYEDGPRADLKDTTAYTRLIKYDIQTRKPVAQYAYRLSPVAHAPVPADEFRVNGISDILPLSSDKLLVMERSYSRGVKNNTIRVYTIEIGNATNINNIGSLKTTKSFTPVKKTLLLDFDTLHTYVDNVEGMTFGPVLPNGHRSMIFVVDNNFDKDEETQFFVFEVE
ncbi:esterase-like activity of phytase family protein [Chitinophaga agri]|uniref:Esterase-like activity of phytase family protein n=1 Tax=Chitinophaga agri TaxID=2703787 RepID=A0A6B9ZHX5_9BACT|nr:esterase-like activity of phytase family protein [Chitinophaga agri]QHS61567.1 esterase-like activity of phytase family protein [Chitinophaga agri]